MWPANRAHQMRRLARALITALIIIIIIIILIMIISGDISSSSGGSSTASPGRERASSCEPLARLSPISGRRAQSSSSASFALEYSDRVLCPSARAQLARCDRSLLMRCLTRTVAAAKSFRPTIASSCVNIQSCAPIWKTRAPHLSAPKPK